MKDDFKKPFITAVIILIVVIIGLSISLFILASPGKNNKSEGKSEDTVASKELSTENATLCNMSVEDDYVYVGEDEKLISVRFTSLNIVTPEMISVPEGYELLELNYTMKTSDGKGVDKKLKASPYIITKNGQYIRTLKRYEIEEYFGGENKDLDERKQNDELSFSEGKVYYVVRTGDIKSLVIYEYTTDNNDISDITKLTYIDDIASIYGG